MLFESRVRLRELAGLCRRLALAVDAGLDDRRIWSREAQQGSSAFRRRLEVVRNAVAQGDSLTDALSATGEFFPTLMRETVAIGEQTGKLAVVLRSLADHYEHLLRLRRAVLPQLVWPGIQLTVAAAVVGLLIWLGGILGFDFLGFGLTGSAGLIAYAGLVAALCAAAWFLYSAGRRGRLWIKPLQRATLRLPWIGRPLETISLARMAWTLHLALDVEMDLRRVMPLALRSSGNALYREHEDAVVAAMARGDEIHMALQRCGVFPDDFVHAVQTAEESGRLVEAMGHLARQYEEQSRAALQGLSVILGFGVWAAVALVMVFLIFRLFSFYTRTLFEAGNL
jgi:type IV pilus assembly protein PilC